MISERHAILTGLLIALEPLEAKHFPALMEIATTSPQAFALTNTPTSAEEGTAYFEDALQGFSQGTTQPYAIRHAASNSLIGTTRLNEIDLRNRKCSIGYTWIDPKHHGDGSNTESKYLLLRHAFEDLGVNRVQFQVDYRNGASRKALERLGAQEEGRLRSHLLAKDGSYRTTSIYSIILEEWEAIQENLRNRIQSHVSTQQATQESTLEIEGAPQTLHRDWM